MFTKRYNIETTLTIEAIIQRLNCFVKPTGQYIWGKPNPAKSYIGFYSVAGFKIQKRPEGKKDSFLPVITGSFSQKKKEDTTKIELIFKLDELTSILSILFLVLGFLCLTGYFLNKNALFPVLIPTFTGILIAFALFVKYPMNCKECFDELNNYFTSE